MSPFVVDSRDTGDGSLCPFVFFCFLLIRASQGTVLGNTAGVTETRPPVTLALLKLRACGCSLFDWFAKKEVRGLRIPSVTGDGSL